MSSNHNDINNSINTGNYEEFFILYMDNELSDEQVKMVDAFLLAHPALRSEWEMLLKTRLPIEETGMANKEALFSDAMKFNVSDETLMLYIDNELSAEQHKDFEKRLSANNELRKEYRLLLKTRLDASEHIIYHGKKDLYRKTGNVVPIKLWLRIAAIFIIMLGGGLFYFTSQQGNRPVQPALTNINSVPVKKGNQLKHITPVEKEIINKNIGDKEVALKITKNQPDQSEYQQKDAQNNRVAKMIIKRHKEVSTHSAIQESVTAKNENAVAMDNYQQTNHTSAIGERSIAATDPSIGHHLATDLNTAVTSARLPRITNEAATEGTDLNNNSIANNSRKGSLKSFLRKATRIIEKRTGIEPSGDNDELLIGALAVKLK